jgi:ketosteroid isomerase-like protein
MAVKTPQEFMMEYQRRTNSHDPNQVAELVAADAIYWFNDGSFVGIKSIKEALRKTWETIQDETYSIDKPHWVAMSETLAACVYTYHWRGIIEGKPAKGTGRGTSVLRKLDGQWKVVHEHLSKIPTAMSEG